MSLPALIGVLVFCAPSRSDTILDFDDLFAYEDVTDQYEDLGVLFGTDWQDTLPNLIVEHEQMAQSLPNVLASAFDDVDGVISFSFSPPALDVSLTAVSVEDGVTVSYYDEQGGLLYSDVRAGTGDYFTPVYFSYTSDPLFIDRVVIVAMDGSSPDAFGIDDVQFVLMPEPATISLLALAVFISSRWRRRRARSPDIRH
jgi:hypothetical protein